MTILLSILVMGLTGAIFAVFLVYGNIKFHVEVDPRIEMIEKSLPGANCSGCGYASCAMYAEAIVLKNEKINKCVVGGDETTEKIGAILGVKAEKITKKVAIILCQGDLNLATFIGHYNGVKDCAFAYFSSTDVSKMCKYGCIGMGTCVRACPFDALKIDSEIGIPVVDTKKCTGCGNCVEACPRHLIELHPIDREIFIYCKNHDPTLVAKNICQKACIACGICVRNAQKDGNEEALKLIDNLAVINFDLYDKIKWEYGEKCPTAAYNKNRNIKK
ncbi:MAG: RnfABCDGE type electron transport complex subunit B [Spirochaetes bacterium]|nr:RnfABCDGE type electron transport complex subunit B [Spirochaetota bacterium]